MFDVNVESINYSDHADNVVDEDVVDLIDYVYSHLYDHKYICHFHLDL